MKKRNMFGELIYLKIQMFSFLRWKLLKYGGNVEYKCYIVHIVSSDRSKFVKLFIRWRLYNISEVIFLKQEICHRCVLE